MSGTSRRTDPLVSHAFREALGVGALFVVAGIWTVGYCYLDGYYRPKGEVPLVMGIPRWAFWGILVPWLICAALSAAFAFYFMSDTELGAEAASPDDDTGADRA